MTAPVTVRPDARVQRAATAVFVTFGLAGFNFATWAARLPAVRDALALRPEQLGLLLLVVSAGSLVALPLSGLVTERLGARRAIAVFATVNVAGLGLASLGVGLGQVWVVGAGLLAFGVGTGVWDAAMNLEGAAVEQRLGRAIMPRFHAGFSFGTMLGAALGAGAAALDVPVPVHLPVVLVLSLVAVHLCARRLLPDEATADLSGATGSDASEAAAAAAAPERAGRRAFGAWAEPRTIMVGLVVLAAALTEGAANDWLALAAVDGFATSDAVGAVVFGVFVTAMTGMRLAGTALLDRWGRLPVLRLSAGLALVGLLVFGLVPWLPLALVGVVLWGVGAALGFPVGMSAASDDPARAPARVAVVATIGYTAFLTGPPLLGLLAEHVGYRPALLAIAVPVVVGLLVIPAARPLPDAVGTARPAGAGTGN